MEISSEEFNKIAGLARLEFSEEEASTLKKSLGEFVSYLDKIKNLDTSHIEPMMRVDESFKELRPDEIKPSLTKEDVFKNAPSESQGYFAIPKIVK